MCIFSTLLCTDIHFFIKSFVLEKVEKYKYTVSYGTAFNLQFHMNETHMPLIHITQAFMIKIIVKICNTTTI